MKYVLEDVNEYGLHLELQNEADFVRITIADKTEYKIIYLGQEELFELLGVLHHIQKNLKK